MQALVYLGLTPKIWAPHRLCAILSCLVCVPFCTLSRCFGLSVPPRLARCILDLLDSDTDEHLLLPGRGAYACDAYPLLTILAPVLLVSFSFVQKSTGHLLFYAVNILQIFHFSPWGHFPSV